MRQLAGFPEATGKVLRRARQARGYTLKDVSLRSRGRFKPSAIGGYERAERDISLKRFCELAEIYGLPPDRLLSQALDELAPETRQEVVIDLERLPHVEGESQDVVKVAEFVHDVRSRRGDYLARVITLRSGDLEAIALASDLRPAAVRATLRPALRRGSEDLP